MTLISISDVFQIFCVIIVVIRLYSKSKLLRISVLRKVARSVIFLTSKSMISSYVVLINDTIFPLYNARLLLINLFIAKKVVLKPLA